MKRILAAAFLFCAPLAWGQADETGAEPVRTPDRTASATLGALNAAATVALEGRQAVGGYLAIGTLYGDARGHRGRHQLGGD